MQKFIGRNWLLSILTQLVDTGGILDGVTIHLFKNNVAIGPQTLLTDLVEADYSGYAASAAVVWGAPFLNALGEGEVAGANHQFQPTGTTVGNDIWGWYLKGTGSPTTPTLVVKYDESVSMVSPLNALLVTPVFNTNQP